MLARRAKKNPKFSKELLDQLVAGSGTSELLGPDGVLKQLTAALVQRALEAEPSSPSPSS